jgi:c-di-GMP-binding flagellar brake protein YcgR
MNANSDASSIGSAAVVSTPASAIPIAPVIPTAPVFAAPATPIMLDRDRRGENRRAVQSKGTITVLDGPLAGTAHEVLTRDLSLSGISFLLRDPLAVGQNAKIDLQSPGGLVSYHCEVVRVREVSNGRYEIGVQFRAKA